MQPPCEVDGCEREGHGLGWCLMHYKRWRKHGDPELGARRVRVAVCTVAGCERPGNSYGLCTNHHRRQGLYGDPLAVAPPRARRPAKRYAWTYAPSHPIATADGKVLTHRHVLYERVGPGPHPCHWCGTSVQWRVGKPSAGALVADHVDHDRSNNDPANLVPSCNPCNGHRLTGEVWNPWVAGSPTGRNRGHRECRKGHPLTDDNVYVNPATNRRQCLTCVRARSHARRKTAGIPVRIYEGPTT